MRVLYLHQHFRVPTQEGGSRPYEFARRLVAAGHEVTVVAGQAEQRPPGTTMEAGATVHWLPVPYRNEMSYRRRLAAESEEWMAYAAAVAKVLGRASAPA